MRKFIIKASLSTILFFSVNILLAQGPPPPPGDPNSGGGPVGGAAPIGSGIGLLLSLGAAYGGKKIYQAWKAREEQLED
jgi:hypothetical protein